MASSARRCLQIWTTATSPREAESYRLSPNGMSSWKRGKDSLPGRFHRSLPLPMPHPRSSGRSYGKPCVTAPRVRVCQIGCAWGALGHLPPRCFQHFGIDDLVHGEHRLQVYFRDLRDTVSDRVRSDRILNVQRIVSDIDAGTAHDVDDLGPGCQAALPGSGHFPAHQHIVNLRQQGRHAKRPEDDEAWNTLHREHPYARDKLPARDSRRGFGSLVVPQPCGTQLIGRHRLNRVVRLTGQDGPNGKLVAEIPTA